MFPTNVLKEVDEILMRFSWSGVELRKYGAKMASEDVCCPLNEGDLGIKTTWFGIRLV